MRSLRIFVLLPALILVSGCGTGSPMSNTSRLSTAPRLEALQAAAPAVNQGGSRSPGYEPAYVNGQTVTINAIEVPNRAPLGAQADFYEVSYPIGWQQLGLAPPQCNPCDHAGDGIDPTDYHDHILDSMPSTGHGEFSPLWHVWVLVPAYNGDPTHDNAVSAAYASHLPTKSEAAVDDLLAARDANGGPIAVKIDTHFYFLCAVVSPNAAK